MKIELKQTASGGHFLYLSEEVLGVSQMRLRSGVLKTAAKVTDRVAAWKSAGGVAANYAKIVRNNGKVRVYLWNADKSKKIGYSNLCADAAVADAEIGYLVGSIGGALVAENLTVGLAVS